jgi:hypothetical protein
MELTDGTLEQWIGSQTTVWERLDDNVWRLFFRSELRDLMVQVNHHEEWVILSTHLVNNVRQGCHRNLFEHLLRVNMVTPFVKLCLDDDGAVVLTAEIPSGFATAAFFEMALDGLITTENQMYVEIMNLATSPVATSSLPRHCSEDDTLA